jgi:hypothetical protein
MRNRLLFVAGKFCISKFTGTRCIQYISARALNQCQSVEGLEHSRIGSAIDLFRIFQHITWKQSVCSSQYKPESINFYLISDQGCLGRADYNHIN